MTVLETARARFQGEASMRLLTDRGADTSSLGEGGDSSQSPASVREAWLREMERTQLAGWFQPFVPVESQALSNINALPRSPSSHISASTTRTIAALPVAYRPPLQAPGRVQELQVNAGHSETVVPKRPKGLGGEEIISSVTSESDHAETASELPAAYRPPLQASAPVQEQQVNADHPEAADGTHAQGTGQKETASFATENSAGPDGAMHRGGVGAYFSTDNDAGALHATHVQAISAPVRGAEQSHPTQARALGVAMAKAALPAGSIECPPAPKVATIGLAAPVNRHQTEAASAWPEGSGLRKSLSQLPTLASRGNVRLLSAETEQTPGTRVHAQWSATGVELWLGMDGPSSQVGFQAAALMVSLQRSLREQGQRLLRVVCNGKVVFDSERQLSHSVAGPPQFADSVVASSFAGAPPPGFFLPTFQKGNL